MTALSTHDTKRSEDVRARISVISEIADEWAAAVRRWNRLAPLGDGPLANLVWQAAVGAWPIEPGPVARLRREGRPGGRRLHRAGSTPTPRSSSACTRWSTPSTTTPNCTPGSPRMADRLRPFGWSNSLSAKLIQLTAPGVPDVYQGTELWDLSLVDPDNRRPVDYPQRVELLARIDDGWLPDGRRRGRGQAAGHQQGAAAAPGPAGPVHRLPAVDRRRRRPPSTCLPSTGAGRSTVATRLPAGLAAAGGWRDTALELPAGSWTDELTGRAVPGGSCAVAERCWTATRWRC